VVILMLSHEEVQVEAICGSVENTDNSDLRGSVLLLPAVLPLLS
jgi:hypothetical protein